MIFEREFKEEVAKNIQKKIDDSKKTLAEKVDRFQYTTQERTMGVNQKPEYKVEGDNKYNSLRWG